MSAQHGIGVSTAGMLDNLLSELGGGDVKGKISVLSQYQNDPVAFGKDILGHTYPDPIQVMMRALLEYEVVVVQSANGVGKSYSSADIALFWMKCFPGSETYISAAPPEKNLKRILWDKVVGGIQQNEDVFGFCEKSGMTIRHGQPPEQSTIDGLTVPGQGQEFEREARFSGKHAPYLLFIIDEGDAVPDAVYSGIESCMSGGMARLLVMFNPRHKYGRVYQMIKEGDAKVIHLSAFNHPNVITGKDVYPGAVTREKTVQRINLWCRPCVNSDDTSQPDVFELPKFLENRVAKRKDGTRFPPLRPGFYKIENPKFFYMVLGEYPNQDENALFQEEWIDAAMERWVAHVNQFGDTPPADTKCIAGLDPAELGPDKSELCKRYGAFVEGFSSWGGVDLQITNDRAEEECRPLLLDKIFVDANGLGAGTAPYLRRVGIPAIGVKTQVTASKKQTDIEQNEEIGEFNRMRDQLLWEVRCFLKNNPAAMLPYDMELKEELLAYSYHVPNGRIRVTDKDTLRHILKRSPNKSDALALTFAPHKSYTGDVMNMAKHDELKRKYCAPMSYQGTSLRDYGYRG